MLYMLLVRCSAEDLAAWFTSNICNCDWRYLNFFLLYAQPASAVVSPTSPWRQEIAQLKKLSVSSPEEESVSKPEWLRIAEEKQKTVSTGNGLFNALANETDAGDVSTALVFTVCYIPDSTSFFFISATYCRFHALMRSTTFSVDLLRELN